MHENRRAVAMMALGFAVTGTAMLAFAAAKAAPVAAGNAERGATLYEDKCGGCHSLDANRIGPAHRGVVGRKAGIAKGFSYSPALKKAGLVWTPANLDRWLINPQATVPGTRMGFRLSDKAQRADIIAYLQREGAPKRR